MFAVHRRKIMNLNAIFANLFRWHIITGLPDMIRIRSVFSLLLRDYPWKMVPSTALLAGVCSIKALSASTTRAFGSRRRGLWLWKSFCKIPVWRKVIFKKNKFNLQNFFVIYRLGPVTKVTSRVSNTSDMPMEHRQDRWAIVSTTMYLKEFDNNNNNKDNKLRRWVIVLPSIRVPLLLLLVPLLLLLLLLPQ